MPTIVQTVSGKVTGLWGKAMIRGADGKMRPLNIGDYVVKGDVILTTQDGIVQLTPEVAPPRVAQEELEFEAPGAGLSGSSLGEGLRVGRIIEETSDSSFTRTQFFDVDRIGIEAKDLRFPPSADPARLSVNEDSILPVRLTGSDPDGTIVRVTVVQVPTGGVLSRADGTPIADNTTLTPEQAAGLIFVPARNFNGNPGDIVFTVTDNQGNVSPPASVTIAVNPVNDAPEPGKVPEGPDDVPIEDPSSNHIPGGPNYRYSTPEDTAVPGVVRAADVDGDRLTYTRESNPSNGTVTVNTDGTFIYTPNPDYNGPDSFVVLVNDGNGGTATSTVFITVTPVNDPPESADASRTTTEGSPYVFEANDFPFRDVDAGNTLAGVRIDALPARGTLQLNGQPVAAGTVVSIAQIASGQLSFVPRPDESGSPYGSFTFSVQDSGGAFDRTPNTFTLGVSPLSNTPVVVDDRISTPEDSAVTINVLANDSDADPEDRLTITAVNDQPITVGGSPVTVTNATGTPIGSVTLTPDNQLVFTPVPNYTGPATFTYTVTDGLTPVSGTVSVAVTPVNDPPQANPDVTNTLEGQPVTIPVRANDSDPDGDPLTITLVGGQPIAEGNPVTLTDPATGTPVGTVSLTPGGELVFTPQPGVNGPISFTYTVTDPAGTPSTATVSVNVGEVNDTPVATPDTGSTNEDTILVVGAASGVVSGVPGRTPSGADTDPDGDTLTVNTVSFGPTAGTVGAPLAGDWGSLVLRPDGSYTYTPAAAAQALRAGDTRSDVFTYSVTDAGGLRATTTLTITVNGVNDGPVAVSDTADTPEDTPVTVAVLANDSDPEGDRLTITAVDGKPIAVGTPVSLTDPITGTPIGTVTLTPAGTLVFNPAPGFNGPVEFPYTVTDGSISDTATVSIVVDSRNDPPAANPDVVTGPQNTLVTFDPRANDADPERDPLDITQINGRPISEGNPVTLPEGVVSLNPDGTLSFLPNPGFNGPLTFSYTVSDGDLTDSSTVTVNIVGGPPEGSDVVESTPEDVPYTVTVANFGFTDPDASDTLAAVRIESLPARGTLTLNDQPVTAGTLVTAAQIAAGALKFVPGPDENGSPYGSFTFSVQDSSGAFDPAPNTFTLNVAPVSDSPAAGNDTATTPEDRSILIDVLANDSDADVGDVLRITQVAGLPITEGGAPVAVANGSVQLVVEGGRQQLLFTPALDYNGPVNFSYTVSDGLTPVTAQVAVTVTPVNDAPDAVNDSVNTPEGRPITINVLANDTDVDRDPLTITSVNGTPISVGGPGVAVPNGTVTLINDPTDGGKPKLVFTPNPGVQGPVTGSFTYGISDGQGGTDTATVNVTVGGINDAPVANPDTGSTNEDTALVRTPAQGVILGAPGADTDVDGDTLTVSAVNGAPTSVGQPVVGQWGTLTLNADGSYRYVPNASAQSLDDGESELDQFSYTVTDGSLTSTTTLTITVTGVNDGPVALDDSATTREGQSVPIRVLANDSDADGDTLTVTQVNGQPLTTLVNGQPVPVPVELFDTTPSGGRVKIGEVLLDPATGVLTFTPVPLYNGTVDFTYTVSDGTTTDTANVRIVVDNVNDPPDARNDVIQVTEDTVTAFDPRANDIDVDGDPLTITAIITPQGTFPISVGSPPVQLANGTLTMIEVRNANGDLVNQLSFNPNPNFNGTQTFDYTISDGRGGTDTATVTLNVNAANDLPTGTDAVESTPEDRPYTVTVANFGFTDPDASDTLAAVRIESLPARGTLTLNDQPVTAGTLVTAAQIAAGALKFVPGPDENGSPYGSFTFSVQDTAGAFDPTPNTFTLNVIPVSDSPAAGNDTATTPEDRSILIDVLANDSDADVGDVLRITQVAGLPITEGGAPVAVVNGSVQLVVEGGRQQLLFTPALDYNGPVNFSYTVSDGLTPVTAQVAVTVTPVNDAPDAVNDSVNTPEGRPITINVLANDTDVDRDPLTITSVNGTPISVGGPSVAVPNGTVTLINDPTDGGKPKLVFTPNPGVQGPVTGSFTYGISDGQGGTDTATVNVTVGGVNDAPVANPDTGSTNEDTALVRTPAQGVILGAPGADTDVDGDTLTVSAVNGAPTSVGQPVVGQWGTLTLNADGSYRYVPNASAQSLDDGESELDQFSYTVTDGSLTSTTTLTITVTGVNDGPVALDDSATTREGQSVPIRVLANDSDADGDTLTVTQVNGQPLTTLVNGQPVPVPVELFDTTPSGGRVKIGEVLLDPATGVLTFTPVPLYNGTVDFTYTVSDGTTTDTANVRIVVDNVNDPPDARNDVIQVTEDTVTAFDPRANDIDVDGDPLTITAIITPQGTFPISVGSPPVQLANGTLTMIEVRNANGDLVNQLSFNPNPNFNGTQTFDYTISDGRGGTDTATVTLNVNAANDLPTGTDAVESTPEDRPYTVTVANFGFTDPDASDTLAAVRIESLPARGTLTLNDQPVTAGTLVTAAQIAAGALKFVPGPDENGSPYGSFTFSVQDTAGAFDPTPNTFTLNVIPVSDSPAAGNDTATTPEDRSILIDVLANDSDADVGDVLRITQVAGLPITEGGAPVAVVNGSVQLVVEGGRQQLLFTPALDYNGPVNFSYTVSDGLTPVTAQVAVTVTPVNDAPDAVNDSVNTPEGRPITIDVLANDTDVDRDPLTITSVNGTPISVGGPGVAVPNGTVTLINDPTDGGKPKLVFTPNPGVQGPVTGSFTYGISDGQGGTDTATVNVTVGGVNDAPVANPDTGSTNEDTALVRTPAQGVILGAPGADTDVDGDTLTVSAVNGAPTSVGQPVVGQWGTLTLNADGSYRYVPNASAQSLDDGESELDQFSYTVTDGSLTSTTTLTITVTGVNDGPVALDDSATTREGQSVPIRVLANDSDADGDTLTVTQVNGQPLTTLVNGQPVPVPVELFDTTPSGGRVKIGEVLLDPATGVLTFTPVPLYNGTVDFTYTVSDGTTTDTANVRIVVDNVNDPPDARNDVIQVTEDTVTAFDPRANDIDVDGDPLTITAIITPQGTFPISVGSPPVQLANGTLTMIEVRNANGDLVNQLSFNPNPNFNGTQTFDYTISDGRGGTDTATVTLNVNAANDLPTGTDAVESTPEDRPYTVTVANFGFTDPDASDTLAAVRIESLPARGTLTLNDQPVTAGTLVTAAQIAAGALKFVPGPDENGSPYGSFTFSVQDTAGAFDPTPNTFTLNVIPVSDSPAAGNDTATTPEDRSILIDVLANDSDADVGDVLRITQVAGLPITEGGAPVAVVNGSVQLVVEGGRQQLLFTPALDYNGPVNFSYTVSDGLTPVTAQVAVTVTPVNDAPDAVNDSVNTPEGRPITIDVLANDTDVDRDPLTITSVNGTPISVGGPGVAVPNGTVTLINDPTDGGKPKLVFTPNPGVQGPVTGSFTYGISDGQGGTDTATVNVTVGGVNDAPVANPDTGSTNEDTALVRTPAQGVILGAPGADTDVDGDTLTVSAVNGAPTSVGQPVVGQWGTLTLNADGSYRYVPNASAQSLDDGESELDQFSYTVTDGSLTSTTTLTITVTGVNDGPVALDDSATTREGQSVPIRVLANDSDADGDTLTVTQVNGQPLTTLVNGQPVPVPVELFDTTPSGGRVKIGEVLLDPATGVLTFTPVPLYNGTVDFTYTVSDGTTTDTANVRIVVDNVNDPPDARNDVIQVTEDTVTAFDPRANDIDVDGDPLTITAIITPQGTFPISVGSPPVQLANGTLTMIEVRNANGDLVNQLSFNPNPNFNGTQTFDYTISDGRGGTDTATVTLSVNAANDAPVANPDTGITNEDTTLIVAPAAGVISGPGADTDVDGDRLNVTAVSFGGTPGVVGQAIEGQWGTLVLNTNGGYTYTPNAASQALLQGESRVDVFDYTVSDQGPLSASSTLRITVTGLSEGGPQIDIPPGAGGPDNTIVEAGPAVTGTFTVSAPDGLVSVVIGGTSLTPAQLAALGTTPVVINTGEGTLTLNGYTPATGNVGAPVGGVIRYSYTAPAQTSATDVLDSVPVLVTDAAGATDRDSLDILVTDTAPTAVADTGAVTEDTAPTTSGNVRDNDVAGADNFAVTAVTGARPGAPGSATPGTYGSLTLNADGTYTYTLDSTNPVVNGLKDGDILRDVFSYTITDADGDPSTTTVTITINGRTDGPPQINPDDADGGARVFEAGLTDPNVNSESTGTRTVTVSTPDGLASVTVGGVTLTATELAALTGTPRVIDTGEGTLTLTGFTPSSSVGGVPTAGSLSYTYTLKAPLNQPGADSSTDTIPLSVTDLGGGVGTGVLPVAIVDDRPSAVNDTASITEDATPNTVSGSVFGNDRVGADANPTPVTPQSVNGTFGSLVLNADGTYTYTLDNSRPGVQALSPTNPGVEVFTYTVTDGDGDTTTATLTVTVNGVNDPTVISQGEGSGQRNVSEEGLPLGLADATGVVDTTDSAVVNGSMNAVDPDTVITGWSLVAPTNAITSQGVPVTWTASADGKTLTGTAGAVEVATLTINDAGAYTFTLRQPIDHPVVNAEDVLSLNFQANALTTGGAITGTGPLLINVEDDSPAVSPPTVVDTTASALDSNLLFVLDTSGSMDQPSGLSGLTRLQASIDSITRLIDRYDGLGDVRVRIVTFSTNAQAQGESWLTVDQAKSLLTTLRATPPTGGTNYDEALADAITAFGSPGKLPTGQNVSYFVTDGVPTFGSGTTSELVPPGGSPGTPPPNGTGQDIDTPDVGIQPGEERIWTDFLNANNVNSFALRAGFTSTDPRETPALVLNFLAPIAWNGQVGADAPGNAVIVPSFADLDGVLAGTLPPPISGNLVDGAIVGGRPGADGLFLDSVTIDGTTYTYAWQTGGGRPTASGGTDRSSSWDEATQTLTVRTLLGGTYTVDFSGANFGQYTYQAPSGVNATTADVLNYVLTDFDGDRSTSSVTVKVEAGTITTALTQHNLMFTLDVSGSMGDSSGIANPAGGTFTRLEAALNSIRSVVAEYAALGDVSVRIVTFASTAAAVGATWLQLSGTPAEKAAQLNTLLTGITAGGGTDYDDALTASRAAYDSAGRIPGAQTVGYFLSDGTPTEQGGITGTEITSWQDWLTARQINSYALGLGTGVGVASLNPIAFDGASGNDSNGIVVTDLNQLSRVLSSTVPPPVSGSLTANLIAGTGTASGQAFVKTVTLDGVTYTFTPNANGIGGSISPSAGASFNPANGELLLTSAVTGAKILIDMDSGNYRYASPERVGGEELVYQLGFADGSVTSSAALKFDVLPPVTPVVGSNALTAETLNGTAGVDRIYGNAGDDEIVGFGGNDLLFGGVGNDRLFGNEGNDRLSAGAGDDIVSGGIGNDSLQGGQGNDRLTGGADSDVFAWQFGDQGTGGAGRAVDTITDFDLAPAANGGDVLDLRDLLGGELKGAGDTVGNLLSYLDITFAGGSTQIRVSTSGGFAGGTYSDAAENQRITLEGVNLSTQLQPGSTLTEAQIIEVLLRNGKLITD